MKENFETLQRNNTWKLIYAEVAAKIVGNKLVYRVKYNPNGNIYKYKARLVAKWYHQTHGVGFSKTFSPDVNSCTIKAILSLAIIYHRPVRQQNVNYTFLNGILTKDVFMHKPEGFIDSTYPLYIYKLNNVLYGLKQVPRA